MSARYLPQRQADENQITALQTMRGRPFFALLMAMRTRKSKVVLDDFGELELLGKAKDFLLIAPGGVYRTWVGAMEADLSRDLLDRLKVMVWSSKYTPKQLAEMVPEFLAHDGPRALLINVEALSAPGRARELVINFLSKRPTKTYVAVDESTIIKNKAARTLFVLTEVRRLAGYRRILSGLATPRSLTDVFFQLWFLDPAIINITTGRTLPSNWTKFRDKVAFMKRMNFGGRTLVDVIDTDKGVRGFRPEAIAAVKQRMEPHSFRVEFRPKIPSTFTIREVEMTKEQDKAYKEIKDFATTLLESGGHVTATVVIAQIVRMHQVLMGHTIDEQGVEHTLPENRTATLLDTLQDYGGKAIIWCSYGFDVRKVAAALAKEFECPVARFWGGNVDTREAEELQFRTDPECRFIVATPDAGGKGRTWDVADMAVFYSNRDNLELRDQAEMRTMGKDKEHGVDNIDLVVPGTVDEKILQALRAKIDMAAVINGDNWRQWVI
jgi:hypothetical protein